MIKAPEKIYLQWHTEDCPENCGHEVTWCWDKIEETDVEYIRKDIFDELLKRYNEVQEMYVEVDKEKELAKKLLKFL